MIADIYAQAVRHLKEKGSSVTTRRRMREPETTRQRLQSVIKESRNIMRKDAGLNGELDRLPRLAWLLFLRAFDDFEEERQLTDRTSDQRSPMTSLECLGARRSHRRTHCPSSSTTATSRIFEGCKAAASQGTRATPLHIL